MIQVGLARETRQQSTERHGRRQRRHAARTKLLHVVERLADNTTHNVPIKVQSRAHCGRRRPYKVKHNNMSPHKWESVEVQHQNAPGGQTPTRPARGSLLIYGCTTRIKSQNEGTSDCTRDPPQPQDYTALPRPLAGFRRGEGGEEGRLLTQQFTKVEAYES